MPDRRRIQVVEEAGNRFLRISNDDAKQSISSMGRFALRPEWKAIRLRARLRTRDLKVGATGSDDARVMNWFEDANGDRTGPWPLVPNLKRDSDWVQLSVRTVIPAGAAYIRLLPGLYHSTGTLDVDDIVVEDAGDPIAVTALPLRPGTPEGTFETLAADGQPVGWSLPAGGDRTAGAAIMAEDGNHFLRLTNAQAGATVAASIRFRVQPTWRALRLRVRLRATALRPGANPLDTAHVQCLFQDANGERLGALPRPPRLLASGGWLQMEAAGPIPPGTQCVEIIPALARATGTLDVDDVRLEVLPAEP